MKALFTSKEAGEYLGYSDDSMRKSRVNKSLGGRLPPKHTKVGRTVRYKKTNLDAWVNELK